MLPCNTIGIISEGHMGFPRSASKQGLFNGRWRLAMPKKSTVKTIVVKQLWSNVVDRAIRKSECGSGING